MTDEMRDECDFSGGVRGKFYVQPPTTTASIGDVVWTLDGVTYVNGVLRKLPLTWRERIAEYLKALFR